MTGVTQGHAGLRELWRRIVDVRRIGGRWWAVIFLMIPAITLVAAGIARLLGAPAPPLDLENALGRLAAPGRLLVFASFILVLGPVLEEIGWRGYALDRLQERWNAVAASLILGAAWGVWHVPLFFVSGYYGEFRPEPAQFMFTILMISVLYTWIHNNTRRSVLAAILFHFTINFTGEFLGPSVQVRTYLALLIAVVVLIVVSWHGVNTLRR